MKKLFFLIFIIYHFGLSSQTFTPRGQKVIVGNDNTLNYMASFDDKGIFVLTKNHKTNNSVIKCTLAPINISREKYLNKPWSNFDIFGNYIFDIVVNNDNLSRIPEGLIQNNPNKFSQNYFFECRDRSTHILDSLNIYASDSNPLFFENIDEISSPVKPIFNYDFIIEENSVSLIIIQSDKIYIYGLNGASQLVGQEWKLLHTVYSPFVQEYFIITKSKTGDHIIHTSSQGEYLIQDFLINPCLKKVSSRNLEERIFLVDRRVNITYEIIMEDYQALLDAENYISHLNIILNTKN